MRFARSQAHKIDSYRIATVVSWERDSNKQASKLHQLLLVDLDFEMKSFSTSRECGKQETSNNVLWCDVIPHLFSLWTGKSRERFNDLLGKRQDGITHKTYFSGSSLRNEKLIWTSKAGSGVIRGRKWEKISIKFDSRCCKSERLESENSWSWLPNFMGLKSKFSCIRKQFSRNFFFR